jgi:activator of HSP90 ATPase
MQNWKNVNNWHWVEKNCLPWAKEYLTEKISKCTLVKLDNIKVTGDVDLNQRKGKVIHVYDIAIEMDWSHLGLSGKITLPEVMHDTNIADIQCQVTNPGEYRQLIQSEVFAFIRSCFKSFNADLLSANAKDVFIPKEDMDDQPTLKSYQPKPVGEAINAHSSNVLGSLVTITLKQDFLCQARDIYNAFLKKELVFAWSRSNAEISDSLCDFSLFNGNITGKITKLNQDQHISMDWRLKTWPEGIICSSRSLFQSRHHFQTR